MNPNFKHSWSPSAVFSPTAARQQALEAKDWAYIDQWLTSHYHPSPVPPFERNSSTLKALLALISSNETANEERELKRQVEAKALRELKARHDAVDSSSPTPLTLVNDSLSPEGLLALHSLSLLTVALSLPIDSTSSSSLATRLALALTTLTKSETHLAQHHLQLLHLQSLLLSRHPPQSTTPTPAIPPLQLQQHILTTTQTHRHLTQKSHEYTSRAHTLSRSIPSSQKLSLLNIPALTAQEQKIEELKEVVLGLEREVKAYQGLPPDRDVARLEVERVEGEWRGVEERRERAWERSVR